MRKSEQIALENRLKLLISIRALFVTVLLGSFYLFEIGLSIFPYPYSIVHLIIFLYVLTIVYSVLLGRVNSNILAYVQLILDSAAVVALIFITGGIESWFSPMMLLIILASPIVINKRAGYVIAAITSIMYGTLIDLQFYKIIPIEYDRLLKEKDFLFNIFAHIVAIFLTAYFTGYLTSRLERTSRSLEKKDTDLMDLTLFNLELVENVPSGLITAGLDGVIQLFNPAAEAITGIKISQAVGKSITSIFPFIDPIKGANHKEGVLETPNGKKVLIFTISEMRDAKGRKTGYIGSFQDLTQIKEMENEIKRTEQLATMGEFSANMAHEIRNPLASLKGAIEILKEGAVPQAQKENLMSIAISEMDRLNRIITDFLTYSRPKGLVLSDFDINTLLDETLALLEARNDGRYDIRRDFDGPLLVKADREKLQQVFLNLGINALDAMPDGGELRVVAHENNGNVEITFSDSGHGVSDISKDKIFYPFYTTKQSGTGLGLSIAYRILNDHNGRIKLSESTKSGTTFLIIMPKVINGET